MKVYLCLFFCVLAMGVAVDQSYNRAAETKLKTIESLLEVLKEKSGVVNVTDTCFTRDEETFAFSEGEMLSFLIRSWKDTDVVLIDAWGLGFRHVVVPSTGDRWKWVDVPRRDFFTPEIMKECRARCFDYEPDLVAKCTKDCSREAFRGVCFYPNAVSPSHEVAGAYIIKEKTSPKGE